MSYTVDQKIKVRSIFTRKRVTWIKRRNNPARRGRILALRNRIAMDSTYVKAKIARLGLFILMTNGDKITRERILANYRDKDRVEKVFHLLKNEMDGSRLRVHS